jgi:DNA-binding NarL/FixJ family response regulator
VLDWAVELRRIWADLELSMNQFASLHPIDKGTISRYLNGQRVPRDRWFLDKLLAIQAEYGQPVTPAVREHLARLQLRALEVAHPHEYRVRRISDELEIALTGKLEAERYARGLEEQLAERNHRVSELTKDKSRLQAARGADYDRLTREIEETTGQLHLARERAGQAERRCQQLEDLLDRLDATHGEDRDDDLEGSAPDPDAGFPVFGIRPGGARLRQAVADTDPARQRARKTRGRTTAQTEQLISSTSAPVTGAPRMVPIRVLIADYYALFRRGLENVLEIEDDIDLVGQARDGAEAVAVAREALPDVVLMDVRMPKISGIEACRAIKEVAPSAKIVMLTNSDEEEDLFDAIRAGASGYLLKDIPLDEVAEAVRAVDRGQSLINPSMTGKLLTEFVMLANRDSEDRAVPVAASELTEQETEVLKLVARGMNNRDIAKELLISENTVKNHIRSILEKLQIHSRMEAVMIAIRQKLIEFS